MDQRPPGGPQDDPTESGSTHDDARATADRDIPNGTANDTTDETRAGLHGRDGTDRSGDVIVVAMVAANGVIGDGEDQPWHIREDLRRFKSLTMGHPLVMGRATYDAIGRLLPGRETVVLTRDRGWTTPGAHVVHDVDEALQVASGLPGGEAVMVLGGGQVYAAMLPVATRLELTEVDAPASGDVVFPEIDPARWEEVRRDDRAALAFVTYERRRP